MYAGARGANGSPVQISRNFRGGAREADRALRQLVQQVEDGKLAPGTVTVPQLLDRWLDHLRPHITPYTLKGYTYTVEASLKPAFKDIRVTRLSTEHVDRVYRGWLDEGVTPATVRKRHTILAAAFHQAVKWGWVGQSPTDRASPPSSRAQLSRVMSVEELRAILVAAEEDDPMLRTAIALAALTGARRGELCALRWSDCELDKGMLHIGRSLTVVDRQWSLGDTKTHQVRRIALGHVALGVIRERMDYQSERAAWDGGGLVRDPFLLSRRADGAEPCLPNGLTHGFRRVTDKLGLPYHFHETRHLAASMMLAGGVDVRTTATRLGHAQPAITLRTYAHMIGSADEMAAGVLGEMLESKNPRA